LGSFDDYEREMEVLILFIPQMLMAFIAIVVKITEWKNK
jgi:hypothetical protein